MSMKRVLGSMACTWAANDQRGTDAIGDRDKLLGRHSNCTSPGSQRVEKNAPDDLIFESHGMQPCRSCLHPIPLSFYKSAQYAQCCLQKNLVHISLNVSRKPDTARPSLSERGIAVACNMKFRRPTAQIPKTSRDLVSGLFRRRKRAQRVLLCSFDTFSTIQDLTKKKTWVSDGKRIWAPGEACGHCWDSMEVAIVAMMARQALARGKASSPEWQLFKDVQRKCNNFNQILQSVWVNIWQNKSNFARQTGQGLLSSVDDRIAKQCWIW